MSELPSISEFRKYRNPSRSSPQIGSLEREEGFRDTINQAVFHLDAEDVGVEGGFGGTVN